MGEQVRSEAGCRSEQTDRCAPDGLGPAGFRIRLIPPRGAFPDRRPPRHPRRQHRYARGETQAISRQRTRHSPPIDAPDASSLQVFDSGFCGHETDHFSSLRPGPKSHPSLGIVAPENDGWAPLVGEVYGLKGASQTGQLTKGEGESRVILRTRSEAKAGRHSQHPLLGRPPEVEVRHRLWDPEGNDG